MHIRLVVESDIAELADWFASTKWPMPASDNIIPETFYVAEDGKMLLACAGLYASGVGASWISWTATNPKASQEAATEAMKAVLGHIIKITKAAAPEISVISHTTKSESFAELMKTLGFRAEKNMIQLTFRHAD